MSAITITKKVTSTESKEVTLPAYVKKDTIGGIEFSCVVSKDSAITVFIYDDTFATIQQKSVFIKSILEDGEDSTREEFEMVFHDALKQITNVIPKA